MGGMRTNLHLATFLGILLGIMSLSESCRADEPLFGFSYTTDLLPRGRFEVEQWSTTRFQKIAGAFWLQDNKTEFEYGLSDRFQFSVYANYATTSAFHNGPFGATTPPEQFSYDVPGASDRYHRSRYLGTSGEAIFRILSPYRHWLGIAVYTEPTFGAGFIETENRVILQKNFRDDRLVFAANLTYAPEFRRMGSDTDPHKRVWQEETDANIDVGGTYRFRPNWYLGFEILNEREMNSFNFTHESNSGYYLGPTVHYGGQHFFATATFVEQMPWASLHVDTVPGALIGGRIYDNDFEKFRVRLRFGWYFGNTQ